MPVKHNHHSGAPDNGDPTEIQPSHWDADHVLTGFLALLDALVAAPNSIITLDGAAQPSTVLLSTLAPSFSPNFTGVPLAPTAALGVFTNQIATMAAVQNAISALVASAPGTLDTLNEISAALGADPNFSATMLTALGNRLRVDAAQGLTTPQKAQAVANLGLAVVAVSGAYADLSGKPTLGTAAALNVGTGANQVVQLDGSGHMPAVDGSALTNVITTGSILYSASQSLTDAQKLQALSNLSQVPQCGRFVYSSATACQFAPFRGDLIKINGLVYRIPGAGIAGLANTGIFINGVAGQNLAASTLYYVFAFINGGVITADFSNTVGHATDTSAGNSGVEVKNGDGTRSLIGMIYTNGSSQFQDNTATTVGVISWFNRRQRQMQSALANSGTITTTYWQEVAAAMRLSFLVWSDENWVTATATGDAAVTGAAANYGIGIGLDGVTGTALLPGYAVPYFTNSNHNAVSAAGAGVGLTEGAHFITMLGGANAGSVQYATCGTTARFSG
jgi:hypothetical protein